MAKKNKSLAEEALLEMNSIKSAIKEESKNTLKMIMEDAVKDALRNSVEDDEDEPDYEVEEPEDNKTEKKTATKRKQLVDGVEDETEPENVEEPVEEPVDGGEEEPAEAEVTIEPEEEVGAEEDEWSEFENYKTADGNYDLTSEKDFEPVLKVWKLLNDDDQLVIRKEGDKLEIKDNESGTEYLVDLGSEDEQGGEETTGLNEGIEDVEDNDLTDDELNALEPYDDEEVGTLDDIEGPNDDEIEDIDAKELNKDFDNIAGISNDDEFDFDEYKDSYDLKGLNENKKNKTRKTMKEGKSKEMIFEVDLGYTDNYQDKDPIQGLSNNEPSKSGKSWHKGVPTGTEKPWAGETESKGDPFEKTEKVEGSVNESEEPTVEEPVEEATNIGGAVQMRSNSKSHVHACRKGHTPEVTRHASVEGEYNERLEEMKKIQNENKQLKEAIKSLKNDLNEAYITNVNLGKITKLFLENTTSQEEKRNIVNRFANEAKTVEQSTALYESIKKQLNENVKKNVTINEGAMTANKTMVNEAKANVPNEFANMIDLIKRMG